MPTNIEDGKFEIDIPSWVNKPYELRKAAEKPSPNTENISCKKYTSAPKSRRTTPRYDLERDTYTPRHAKQKKKTSAPIKAAGAILTAALTICGVRGCNGQKTPVIEPEPTKAIEQTFDNYIVNENETQIVLTAPETVTILDSEAPLTSEAPKETNVDEEAEIKEEIEEKKEISAEAKNFLHDLEITNGEAWKNYDTLCEQFGLSQEDMAEKIVYFTNSPEWADGCTTPRLLCAQMYRESCYIADKTGDNGEALGLGQFHKCAVDDVNRIYGTNYKYADRKDPQKALEMMTLYLKYCYKQTNKSRYAMLAMYNAGHKDAINHQYGKEYVNRVLEKLNMEM